MKRNNTQKIFNILDTALTVTLYLSLMMGFQLPSAVQQIASALLLLLTVSAGAIASYLINYYNEGLPQFHLIRNDKSEEIKKAA